PVSNTIVRAALSLRSLNSVGHAVLPSDTGTILVSFILFRDAEYLGALLGPRAVPPAAYLCSRGERHMWLGLYFNSASGSPAVVGASPGSSQCRFEAYIGNCPFAGEVVPWNEQYP